MAKCRVCGATVAASAWKCEQCGSQIATMSMIWAKVLLVIFVVGLLLILFANWS